MPLRRRGHTPRGIEDDSRLEPVSQRLAMGARVNPVNKTPDSNNYFSSIQLS